MYRLVCASTHHLRFGSGGSNLAGSANLVNSPVADGFFCSHDRLDISTIVLSYHSYTPTKSLMIICHNGWHCFSHNRHFNWWRVCAQRWHCSYISTKVLIAMYHKICIPLIQPQHSIYCWRVGAKTRSRYLLVYHLQYSIQYYHVHINEYFGVDVGPPISWHGCRSLCRGMDHVWQQAYTTETPTSHNIASQYCSAIMTLSFSGWIGKLHLSHTGGWVVCCSGLRSTHFSYSCRVPCEGMN